jgi:hypothetical protein
MTIPQKSNNFWLAKEKVKYFKALSLEVNYYVCVFLIKRKLMS